jgi:hypothetical protein
MSVLGSILSNQTYRGYKISRLCNKQSVLSKDGYNRNAKLIYKAMTLQWEQVQAEFWEDILKRPDNSSIMCLDFAWAHRNWHSSQGELIMLDFATGLPFMCITLNKQRFLMGKLVKEAAYGYGGTSKGMEGFALRIALDIMAKKGLLNKFSARVHDQDATTEKIFASREDCKHLEMFLDPGHKKKNISKTLKALFGTTTRFQMLTDRMGAFFMRCIKEACIKYPDDKEAACLHFVWLFSFWVSHYTQGPCEVQCPCQSSKVVQR